jgi:hypothetical protein
VFSKIRQMIRLHLVGFTTDLKNLIFARRRGAKSGGFIIEIDNRLKRTLEEVGRLEEEKRSKGEEEKKARRDGQAPVRSSKLTPKEIQGLLRRGRSPQEVARLAETDVSWIDRFSTPVIAERAGVVDAVRAGTVSKARLGPSSLPVGDSIMANLRERRINIPPDILDEGWSARMRDNHWEVTFRYLSRGQRREAAFAYDSGTRQVNPLNTHARDLAWRPAQKPAARKTERPARRPRRGRGRSGSR